jgi:hypothetical protein
MYIADGIGYLPFVLLTISYSFVTYHRTYNKINTTSDTKSEQNICPNVYGFPNIVLK